MLTIIGCGNLNRSDDGIGVIVAQALSKWYCEYKTSLGEGQGVRVYDCGTGGMDVMFQARGSSQLIIIDASSTNSDPGTIYKVPGFVLEQLPEPSYTLHDFRWDHAIAAGRKIFKDQFPQDVTVYLIEAENLDLGIELSPVVQQAGDRVIAELKNLICSYESKTDT